MNFGLLFLGFWFCALATIVFVVFRKHARLGKESTDWKAIKGEITKSSVQTNDDGDPYPDIHYRYYVGKDEFENNKITFEPITLSESVARGYTSKYPKGKCLYVFVDPNLPRNSVLERGMSKSSIRSVMATLIFFFVVGILLLYFGWTTTEF